MRAKKHVNIYIFYVYTHIYGNVNEIYFSIENICSTFPTFSSQFYEDGWMRGEHYARNNNNNITKNNVHFMCEYDEIDAT